MTLLSIANILARNGQKAENVPENVAQYIVSEAIATDLALGVEWLRQIRDTKTFPADRPWLEDCFSCWVRDAEVRKQVARLAAYDPLQRWMESNLGLYVRLQWFRKESHHKDGGPGGRLVVMPLDQVVALKDKPNWPLSSAHTWRVIQWGAFPQPPALVSEEEARGKLWAYAEERLAEGLAHLQASIAEGGDGLSGPAELIPVLIQLIGVPGMRKAVEVQLNQTFQLYNCCKSLPTQPDNGDKVYWRMQLLSQATRAIQDC